MNKPINSVLSAVAVVVVAIVLALAWTPKNLEDVQVPSNAKSSPPELVFEMISSEYEAKILGVRILIVPGHDLLSRGAAFRGQTEESLTRELGQELENILLVDGRFEVITARDFTSGQYTDEFAAYFASAETQIKRFRTSVQETMDRLVKSGRIEETKPVMKHNFAAEDVSLKLYGINKWANENNIDLALHIHFNDYPRRDTRVAGRYKGFAIYAPERQFGNSGDSRKVAQDIFQSLSYVAATSTFPLESAGIIETQDLIAAGSYNSQTHPALLIEYGYIYEPKFSVEGRRGKSLPILAEATYRGIVRHFFGR